MYTTRKFRKVEDWSKHTKKIFRFDNFESRIFSVKIYKFLNMEVGYDRTGRARTSPIISNFSIETNTKL